MKLPLFKPEWLNLDDYKLGSLVLGQFIAANAEESGFNVLNIPEAYGTKIVECIQKLPDDYDYGSTENAALFLALRLAANGKFELAGNRFRSFFDHNARMLAAIDEANTGRRKQKKKAQKDRPGALGIFIQEIVRKSPKISEKELLRKIEDAAGQGDIQEVTQTEIWFTDKNGNSKPAPINGLKNRLSNAKKKLNSR